MVLWLELLDLHVFNFVEQLQQRFGAGKTLIKSAQECGGCDLGALIDAHCEHIFLGHFKLDPTSTLWTNARAVQRTITDAAGDGEIHARAAVQLTHNDALGTVHNELAAAHHDWNFTEINIFFADGLRSIARQANLHAEGETVRQTKFTALVRRVAWLLEFVLEIFQLHRAVVTFNWKNFTQQRFDTNCGIAFVGRFFFLKETLVSVSLNLCKVWDGSCIAAF